MPDPLELLRQAAARDQAVRMRRLVAAHPTIPRSRIEDGLLELAARKMQYTSARPVATLLGKAAAKVGTRVFAPVGVVDMFTNATPLKDPKEEEWLRRQREKAATQMHNTYKQR